MNLGKSTIDILNLNPIGQNTTHEKKQEFSRMRPMTSSVNKMLIEHKNLEQPTRLNQNNNEIKSLLNRQSGNAVRPETSVPRPRFSNQLGSENINANELGKQNSSIFKKETISVQNQMLQKLPETHPKKNSSNSNIISQSRVSSASSKTLKQQNNQIIPLNSIQNEMLNDPYKPAIVKLNNSKNQKLTQKEQPTGLSKNKTTKTQFLKIIPSEIKENKPQKDIIISDNKMKRVQSSNIHLDKSIVVIQNDLASMIQTEEDNFDEQIQKQLEKTKFIEKQKHRISELKTKQELIKNNKFLDRIIPYGDFSDKCNDVLKSIKYATKDQKMIYEFNKKLIENPNGNAGSSGNGKEYQPVIPFKKLKQLRQQNKM